MSMVDSIVCCSAYWTAGLQSPHAYACMHVGAKPSGVYMLETCRFAILHNFCEEESSSRVCASSSGLLQSALRHLLVPCGLTLVKVQCRTAINLLQTCRHNRLYTKAAALDIGALCFSAHAWGCPQSHTRPQKAPKTHTDQTRPGNPNLFHSFTPPAMTKGPPASS